MRMIIRNGNYVARNAIIDDLSNAIIVATCFKIQTHNIDCQRLTCCLVETLQI